MQLLLVLLITIRLCQAQLCMNGTVRLQNGPSQFEGRVEVCLSEEWRTVCNDFWGHNEAMVVCRQLGFATSGIERFVDLRGSGGPDVGIDNSNCTGMEERLIDCSFSREVSDCNSNQHKVGVRCHEERAPRNLKPSINGMTLKIDWDAPERGVTNEQIQSFVVACSFLEGNEVYTLKHTVSVDVFEAFLPIGGNISTSAYNCCVEAVFEMYSSKACTTTPAQLIVNDSNQQHSICSSTTSIQVVAGIAGALTSVIVVLLTLLLVAVTALICMWRKIQSKEEHPKIVPVARSDTQAGRVLNLDDRVYEEQESRVSALNKTPLGRYSSTGPEYEPIQTMKTNRGGNQSIDRDHRLVPDGTIILRPASYEIPISSDIQTLNTR